MKNLGGTYCPFPSLLPLFQPAHHDWGNFSIRIAQIVRKCIPRQFYEQSSNL